MAPRYALPTVSPASESLTLILSGAITCFLRSEKKAGPEAGFPDSAELLLFFVLLHLILLHHVAAGRCGRGILRSFSRGGRRRRWRRRFRSFCRGWWRRRWCGLVAGGQAERKQCCEEERAFHDPFSLIKTVLIPVSNNGGREPAAT